MNSVIFRPPQAGDIAYVAANIREADRQEVVAATGRSDIFGVICDSVLRSTLCWTVATEEDTPVCMVGVVPLSLLGGVGSPWLLGTDLVFRGALVREARRYVQRMLAVYPHLYNYVDARNERSVRWLAHIGFEIQPAQPFGPAKLPFHRFEKRA